MDTLKRLWIRFIAVNDNVDSENQADNDFTPFRTIINEWYAKDTSNKIKAVFKARMKNGMRCSGSIPYGYKRTKEDKQQLLVDEPAAEVVRKIFRLACQGIGVTAIAEMLSAEKILIPSAYAARYFPENCRHSEVADPYRWSATTVGYILDRQEYLGHTVLGKSICENFKTKQRRAATADELMIFPETHEAIIEQDTWDIAHKLRLQKRPKAANGTYTHRLSGLIYCADCGARMNFCSPDRVKSGKRFDSDSAFQCGNYRNTAGQCVSHFVAAAFLCCGTATDPEKGYNIEFLSTRYQLSQQLEAILAEHEFHPHRALRKGANTVYIKAGDHIEDLLTFMGAGNAAMRIMEQRMYNEMRNKTNRLSNCETANLGKSVQAAVQVRQAIETLEQAGALDTLPAPLPDTARLRLAYPDLPLSKLGQKFDPPVSKAGLCHRFKRIQQAARRLQENQSAAAAPGKEHHG